MNTIGIDIGGTNLRAALLDDSGELKSIRKIRLTDRRPEVIAELISQAVDEIARDSGVPATEIAAAAVGTAGQIRKDTGVVAVGPNLGWREVPFRDMLAKRLPFPVDIVNDLSCAAWGERLAGAGKHADDLILFAVGSGVGSGIIVAGKLVDGTGGLAGEIGHIKVVPGGRRCGCGEDGCLEAYAGGHNIAARRRELGGAEGQPGSEPGAVEYTVERICADYETGDPLAKKVLDEAGDYLAMAAANLITVFNPKVFILGGGVLLGCPTVRAQVLSGIDRLAARPARAQVEVCTAVLGDDAGLMGAAHLAREIARR